jgi:hypothetical protein
MACPAERPQDFRRQMAEPMTLPQFAGHTTFYDFQSIPSVHRHHLVGALPCGSDCVFCRHNVETGADPAQIPYQQSRLLSFRQQGRRDRAYAAVPRPEAMDQLPAGCTISFAVPLCAAEEQVQRVDALSMCPRRASLRDRDVSQSGLAASAITEMGTEGACTPGRPAGCIPIL